MPRLLIAFLTVLVFGAGYGARLWTENVRAVPPPPEALGSEFVRPPVAIFPVDGKDAKQSQGVNRANLIREIEKARPQIEAYRAELQELDAEFDQGLIAFLTPEQAEKYLARQKRIAERRLSREARQTADNTPLSDEQILRLQQVPLFNVLWSITISPRLDRLHRDLDLDAGQQERARELLHARRNKFLALVDSSPPPTVTLSELATRTRMLAEPVAEP
jgi:hypothetical protein